MSVHCRRHVHSAVHVFFGIPVCMDAYFIVQLVTNHRPITDQSRASCHSLRDAWFCVGFLRGVLFLVCGVLFRGAVHGAFFAVIFRGLYPAFS